MPAAPHGPLGRVTAPFALAGALAHLRQHARWVGWKWTQKPNGEWDKPLYRADYPDFYASTQKPKTWVHLDAAERSLIAGQIDGIGYVVRDDPDTVFWDLDNCRDPITGELDDWAAEAVEAADSYTEITPSGRGLRIVGTHGGFLHAPIHAAYKLPSGGTGEVFFRAVRYVTVTGLHLPETPNALSDISGAVLDLLAKAGRAAAHVAAHAAEGTPGKTREEAAAPLHDVVAALAVIPNADDHYDDWVRVGLATYAATGGQGEGLDAWMRWSGKSVKHTDHECLRVWQSFHRSPPNKIGFGSLYYLARKASHFFVAPSWQGVPVTDEPAHDPETGTDAPPKACVLWIDPDGWEESDIPKRPWLVPGYFMRGSVSVLSGQGAGGKSSIVVAWTIAAALGQPLGEFRPARPLVCVNYNVEDDQDEQRRRYSAALRAGGHKPASIANKVVRCGPNDIGTLFQRDGNTGLIVPTAAMQALERLCMETQADILVCDPLAELHNAEENDNTAMRGVIAAFRSMAQRLGIAILILHHDRKGNNAPGDMDRMRGASAITGAVRVMLTLSPMSVEEADKMGIKPEDRRRHFRIDGAKSNYAIAQEAEWWKLAGYTIPNGEEVAACLPWSPPSPFDGLTMADCVAVLDAIHQGTPAGFAWAATKQAGADWAGRLLVQRELSEAQSTQILAMWKTGGALEIESLDGPRRGHPRQAYTVNLGAVAEMRHQFREGGF